MREIWAGPLSLSLRALPMLLLLAVCAANAETAQAKDLYADPAKGTASGDGSKEKPWQTLETVLAAGHFGSDIQAGDTLWLATGYHGAAQLMSLMYASPVTIAAIAGQTPTISKLSIKHSQNVVVRGLSISPSYAPTPMGGQDMVSVSEDSSQITVADCNVFSVKDASGWTADQWINTASSGISVGGDHVTISHNHLENVRFGISVDGTNAHIIGNEVVNFSADGMRGLGDNGVFEYNLVKNVYVDDTAGDDNHDDGFQSWSVGTDGMVGTGVVKGVVLRGNIIINREDPNQKLTNSLQGIGCFDGFFEDWVVENNIVATDHWHGISFYGMRNSRIVNNTVIDVTDGQPGPPWILVTAHKDMRPSENVVVRNNLATDYDLSGTNVTDDHNTTLTKGDLATYFVNPDPSVLDLHLLPNAPAVNMGSSDQAPTLDLERIARPQGSAVDLGAYEWHDPSVKPEGDAGIGLGDSDAAVSDAGASDAGGGAAAGSGVGIAGSHAAGSSGGASNAGSGTSSAGTGAGTLDDGGMLDSSTKKKGCSCAVVRSDRQAPALGLWLLGLCLAARSWRRTRGRA